MTNGFTILLLINHIKGEIFRTLSLHFFYYIKTAFSFYFCSLDWQEQLKAFSALLLLRKCGCEHISALKNMNGFFFLSDLHWQVTFNRKPWQ